MFQAPFAGGETSNRQLLAKDDPFSLDEQKVRRHFPSLVKKPAAVN